MPPERRDDDQRDQQPAGDPERAPGAQRGEAVREAGRECRSDPGENGKVGEVRVRTAHGEPRQELRVQEQEGNGGREHHGTPAGVATRRREPSRHRSGRQERPLYWPFLIGSRLLWRRSATALGIYGSTALGIIGSLVVLRVLGPDRAGRFSLVVGTAAFFQLLLELTSDEALVKYGFRYAVREDWGRFHRLVRLTFTFELAASLVAGGIVAALAPFTGSIFHGGGGLTGPMLLAALLPPLQAVESMGAAALILRGRYDIRGAFLTFSMGLRLAGIAVGTQVGVTATVLGVL